MITIHKRLEPTWEEIDGSEFLIRALNSREVIDAWNETLSRGSGFKMTSEGVLRACQVAVSDWKNIVDDDGNAVPFSVGAIETLPANALISLATVIMGKSYLSGAERKNS